MHGRIKTRTSIEEQARKKREREEKVKLYKSGMEKAFGKRQKAELDEELLMITGHLLSANPDVYTLWNFRKEIMLHFKETRSMTHLDVFVEKELLLTEACLRANPKSYGAWHHRCWLLDNMPSPDWSKELALCNKYLTLDERNFHCWDHRRFVVSRSGVLPTAELDYTTEKISINFSNYSSWHYRSKLLPLIHPDPLNQRPIKEDIHKEELELVKNAAFTDPNDQSAWFYQRWLLGQCKKQLKIVQAVVSNGFATIAFNQAISPSDDIIQLAGLGGGRWRTPNNLQASNVWIKEVASDVIDCGISTLLGECVKMECPNFSRFWSHHEKPKFGSEFSVGLTEVLQDELDSCDQLLLLEPANKWTLLTSVLLMQAIDGVRYKAETMQRLNQLVINDPLRVGYYKDLRSRYMMEYLLNEQECVTTFIGSDQGLSALYHAEYLLLAVHVDLSCNTLMHSLPQLHVLQCCLFLNLDSNGLASMKGFPSLPKLQSLSLKHNKLAKVEDIVPFLIGCPMCTKINLEGNPIDQSENVSLLLKQCLITT